MTHVWKYTGSEYLYTVETPNGPVIDKDPLVKLQGTLLHEGLMHTYTCQACNAKCVNEKKEPVKIPEPCVYDIN